jgi:hypothetical protein
LSPIFRFLIKQRDDPVIKIYNAGDIIEAHIVRGLLEAEGIEAYVGGHYLQGGVGELATQDFATIHVIDEHADRAKQIIRDYERNQASPGPHADDTRRRNGSWLKSLFIVVSLVLLFIIYYITGDG